RKPRSAEMKQQLDATHARLAAAEAELSRITRTMGAVSGGTGPQPRPRTEPSLEAPVPFGRYELLKCIGQGGMARVFLALARGTGGFERLFVIKRLHEPLARQPEAVAHFVDEARLGASLVHSNIIPVYDFGQVDGEYYMASEYILGRDLDTLVRRSLAVDGVALAASAVLFIAREALQALAYAHGRRDTQGQHMSLVHRDVSANNILASAQGEVKLLDFGIAKSADRTAQHTQAGLVKGNVNFMAPEQARGQDVDARADLFSLGLTLYWCLTGEYLYDGRTDYDRLVQSARGPGPAEWERVDRLPEPLVSLLRRALQPDPAARFQSAEEFARALPPLGPEGGTLLAHSLLRLFDAELRAETAYRTRLIVPAVSLDQAQTG
ncbi:serine/threonine-protein kinase, partial [Pyxidicoccus sp. 3LFB2]